MSEHQRINQSKELFKVAQNLMPGGVNSPVRAFKSVGGDPVFIDHAKGAYLWDVDGNRYVDYVLSWGPMILGHADDRVVSALQKAVERGTSYGAPTLLENQLAELVVDIVPSIEMIRFVNSGTEATMSALRLARAYTGRSKIIKFAGCYHGHADMLLVQAGSGVATLGLPDSPGIPASATTDTLLAQFNDIEAVRGLFEQYPEQIAAVIIEPIAANMGFVMPQNDFLHQLQSLCHKYGALFILDEVMTGFRVAKGGAQSHFNLEPDITCLGKVIGGGLPVGAYGGKRYIMEYVAPAGPMYQAGTLSGNPLAMTAGYTTLQVLQETDAFESACTMTQQLVEGLQALAEHYDFPMQIASCGTMFGFYFLKDHKAQIVDYVTAKRYADTSRYAMFFHYMLEHGIYFAPSQFEAAFMSSQHTSSDIDHTL
ncbi:MAG: glutamate-1-semialdehyde-2,1-aminomutase, partial [Phototrophicales bacterium]